MFYRPADNDHGMPHNPFKAIVSPRPIGWISTLDEGGVANLAPYSFFNALCDTPPMVMFGSTGIKPDQKAGKDSLENIRATGEFAVNIVSYALREPMNQSAASFPATTDEFEAVGLTKADGVAISAPHVGEAPAVLECKLFKIITLPGAANSMVIGEVVGVHIQDDFIVNGRFDVTRYKPLSRLGYMDYAHVEQVFELIKPA
ncbi:MAG: flavin reductase family protein [Rhodobacteraceae bacterium]|nr:flavin reductase family protein [Paracoccaceae bacterium]